MYYIQQLYVCSEEKRSERHLRRELSMFSHMQQGKLFSKYVILFNGKSLCLGHLMFTGFGKNILEAAHCCTILILLYCEYIILCLSTLCNLVFLYIICSIAGDTMTSLVCWII